MSFTGANRFSVKGNVDGRPVTVSYEDGDLSGDDDAVTRVRQVLDERSEIRLTPQDEDRPAEVGNPHAVMAAIQEVMAIEEVEGDYPIPDADDSAS
jgi:hypothetical protein